MDSTESPFERQKLVKLPSIAHDDPFVKVVKTLSMYVRPELTTMALISLECLDTLSMKLSSRPLSSNCEPPLRATR